MLYLTFSDRFAPLIREGYKTQSFRRGGRYPQVNDTLRLLRADGHVPICPDVRCTAVRVARLAFTGGRIVDIWADGLRIPDFDRFAVEDGFETLADMSAFFRMLYPVGSVIKGVLIEWAAPRATGRVAA